MIGACLRCLSDTYECQTTFGTLWNALARNLTLTARRAGSCVRQSKNTSNVTAPRSAQQKRSSARISSQRSRKDFRNDFARIFDLTQVPQVSRSRAAREQIIRH